MMHENVSSIQTMNKMQDMVSLTTNEHINKRKNEIKDQKCKLAELKSKVSESNK